MIDFAYPFRFRQIAIPLTGHSVFLSMLCLCREFHRPSPLLDYSLHSHHMRVGQRGHVVKRISLLTALLLHFDHQTQRHCGGRSAG